MTAPATAQERFYVPQAHCGFVFRYAGGNPRCLATSGMGPCVGLTLYTSGAVSGKNGALAHFDSDSVEQAMAITLAIMHEFRSEAGTPPQKARVSWNRNADKDFAANGTTLALRNGIWRALNETGVADIGEPVGFTSAGGTDIYLDLNDGSSGLYRERIAPHVPLPASIGPRASLYELGTNLGHDEPILRT